MALSKMKLSLKSDLRGSFTIMHLTSSLTGALFAMENARAFVIFSNIIYAVGCRWAWRYRVVYA